MRWLLKQKNILDEPAEVLVCSANVHLTLSGGVGAELLARYGSAMQVALANSLQTRQPRCAQRGEVIAYVGPEMPYQLVLHAVAIDGWYVSTPLVVTDVTRKSLGQAAEHGAKTVALTALATGFGRLTFAEFAEGIRPLVNEAFPPVEQVAICLLLDFELAELAGHLPQLQRVPPLPHSLIH